MSPTLIVIAAILSPALLYLFLALREQQRGLTLGDFFPLTRFVPGDQYGRATAAAGVSLATVVLALLNLTPVMGLGLLVTIVSYVGGFVALYILVPSILRANPNNSTLQAYLGNVYASRSVKVAALVFTFVGYLSIFSMELTVGVTVLKPFFPNDLMFASVGLLLFIAGYSVVGGFKAIVATEQWQIRAVVLAVAILGFVAIAMLNASNAPPLERVADKVLETWKPGLIFAVGIAAMNVPAAISDAATWQRLCATRSEADARNGLRRAIAMFTLIWGALIVAGTFIAITAAGIGAYDPARQPLMDFILQWLSGPEIWKSVLLFGFIVGLFAALITTADSLLLIAAQLLALDVFQLQKAQTGAQLPLARLVLAGIALASFLMFLAFQWIKLDIVQLVFAIYGAQIALFPATVVTLVPRFRPWLSPTGAIVSIVGGFAAAWASALYGRFGGDPNWLYNAPVAGLMVSGLILSVAMALSRHRNKRIG